ncbi:outer membrane protein [Qipengyuania sphaerica]|uniref:outer membrane protein n=1 Tax=Qipengyuania sphaerica TaxID=2867243 RepID=UPI001C8850FC|nr:outer membrane beta-barrel protein [Qipengyuania sphaerica]MBX7541338.1 porin family protein [Qipengyuania sphaerica]
MKKIFALAVLGAGLAATPAMAQDNEAIGGLYVGALAGFEGVDVESAGSSVTLDGDAAVYGLTAGYDLSLGSAFVGVEGEISTSDSSAEFPSGAGAAYDGLKTSGQYYVGARAGLALTPGIAAYGKAGYTSLDTSAFTSAGSLSELKENSGGFRFGGGLQVALPGPLEARLEYRRSKYDDSASGEFGEVTTDQIVAGLGLRF